MLGMVFVDSILEFKVYFKCYIIVYDEFNGENIIYMITRFTKISKEVGITIKSEETSSKLASYPAMKSLATHSTSCTGYYLCLFKQIYKI